MWQQDNFFLFMYLEYFSSYCLGLTLYKHAILYALFLYNNFHYERNNMNNTMMPIHFGLYLFNTCLSFH